MQDRELVAAIVAGDPGGLAEAYDRYAAPLYTYCRFMLPDPDPMGHAASAVRDTFIVASARLEGLRDPDKLRSWLHAVARNECLRQLGADTGAGSATRLAGKADPGRMPEAVLPSALREQVLKACADDTPTGRAYRASVAHRAGPFGWTGFPKPILPPGPRWWYQVRRHPRVAAAIAAVAFAAVVGGITVLLTAGGSPGPANPSIALGNTGTTSSAASSPAGARSSPSHKAAAAGKITTPSDAPTTSSPATGPSSPTSPAPSSTSPSPSHSPSRSPSPSPSPSHSPSPSPSPSQTPPGFLLEEPSRLVLTEVKGKTASATFDLVAVGGPVHWTVHLPAISVATIIAVSPSSGYLKFGGSVAVVTVTIKSPVSLTARLVADPGGLPITIVLNLKL
jgi:hypothetical protein